MADEAGDGIIRGADHLLVLRRLLRDGHVRASHAARLCHRGEEDARGILSTMESEFGYLNRVLTDAIRSGR